MRSAVTTVPVSGPGSAAVDSQRASQCIAAAQTLYLRCLEGSAARERSHRKAWRTRPPLPIEPVREVTPKSLETTLLATVERIRSPQAAPVAVSYATVSNCQVG